MSTPDLKPAPFTKPLGSAIPELKDAKALLTPRTESFVTRPATPAPSAVVAPTVTKVATKAVDADAQKLQSKLEQNRKKQKELQGRLVELEARQKAQREALRVEISSLSQTKAVDDDKFLRYGSWCLTGELLQNHPELAINMLEALKRNPKRPAFHAEAIENLLINRGVLKDPKAPPAGKVL